MWDKTLAYGRQAGEKAMAQSAYHEAVLYRAMEMTFWLPETKALLAQVEAR
jgi:hypothetical protein